MTTRNVKRLTVTIRQDHVTTAEALADAMGTSVSWVIAQALADYLNGPKPLALMAAQKMDSRP